MRPPFAIPVAAPIALSEYSRCPRESGGFAPLAPTTHCLIGGSSS